MKTTIWAIITAILLAGCATKGANGKPAVAVSERSQVFRHSFDKTWAAVVTEFSGSYPFDLVQKDSGLIQTKRLGLNSGIMSVVSLERYAINPATILTTYNQADFVIYFVISKESETDTRVTTRCKFQAFENNLTGKWTTWQSQGVMEQELLDRMTKRLGSDSGTTAVVPVAPAPPNPPVPTKAPQPQRSQASDN